MAKPIKLPPHPVYLIKSISEQGYSLSTAISDLIDNSIAAGASRVEILIDTKSKPLQLYVADNGAGMSAEKLTESMRFPSCDLDLDREVSDLGRFGLGLKTASFSQSRKFSVLSRQKDGRSLLEGRTWDVEYLKKTKEWTLIEEDEENISKIVAQFEALSHSFHNRDESFEYNTIVAWDQLYKLERLGPDNEIKDELDELRHHLSLVFHRLLNSSTLVIRLNNQLISSFDPFPVQETDVQSVVESYWQGGNSYVKFQGIILPKRAAEESKSDHSLWCLPGKSLQDLQGIYVYRNGRLISWGSWLRSIPRGTHLQFGRVTIDITNSDDGTFHLNVAKSSLKLPFGLRKAMADTIRTVASQAMKEYRERIASTVIRSKVANSGMNLITKETTAAGAVLKINSEFEIIRQLQKALDEERTGLLDALIQLLEKKLNEFWSGEALSSDSEPTFSEADRKRILNVKGYYEQAAYSPEEIVNFLLDSYRGNEDAVLLIKSLYN